MATQNSTLVKIYVGSTPIAVACLTSNSWESTSDLRETTCKDTDGHRTYKYGMKGWTMSCEGMLDQTITGATNDPFALHEAMQARTELTVLMGSGVSGDRWVSGIGLVASYSENFDGVEDNATWSASLTGSGQLADGEYA